MNIRQGLIEDIVFYGDFMATSPLTALCEALRGIRPERSELGAVLSRFDLFSVFGTITKAEVLGLILGEGDGTWILQK